MRRIGRVLHISPSKKAVINTEETPRIGGTVIDEKGKRVGRVFDVFGPTVSPYVTVELEGLDPQHVVGSVLFSAFPPKRKKRRRK